MDEGKNKRSFINSVLDTDETTYLRRVRSLMGSGMGMNDDAETAR